MVRYESSFVSSLGALMATLFSDVHHREQQQQQQDARRRDLDSLGSGLDYFTINTEETNFSYDSSSWNDDDETSTDEEDDFTQVLLLDNDNDESNNNNSSRTDRLRRNEKRTIDNYYSAVCVNVLIILAVLSWLAGGFYAAVFVHWQPNPIASCGDCHCAVLPTTGKEECPAWVPKTDYSQETINALESQVALNPYSLKCNPYHDDHCTTEPQQDFVDLGENAVCALHYETTATKNSSTNSSLQYRMVTYPSRLQAEEAGGFVTHASACGVCSTTQDLAAYLRTTDLTTEGKYCTKLGLLSFHRGIDCYLDLGFTQDCATMWIYNGYQTRDKCLFTCLVHLFSANNAPFPDCRMNKCLQCDEENSGPLFKAFAGRTRRRSGLLSAIVRPCDSLHRITHVADPYQSPPGH